jgi:hypothetical protein
LEKEEEREKQNGRTGVEQHYPMLTQLCEQALLNYQATNQRCGFPKNDFRPLLIIQLASCPAVAPQRLYNVSSAGGLAQSDR